MILHLEMTLNETGSVDQPIKIRSPDLKPLVKENLWQLIQGKREISFIKILVGYDWDFN